MCEEEEEEYVHPDIRVDDILDQLEAFDRADPDEVKWLIDQFAKARDAVKGLMPFTWPEITRGPAKREWIEARRKAAEVLGWVQCPYCALGREVCITCYNVGLVSPEEIE